jgi:hypothetical protein
MGAGSSAFFILHIVLALPVLTPNLKDIGACFGGSEKRLTQDLQRGVVRGRSKSYREFVVKWKKLAAKVVWSLEEAGEELLIVLRFS